MLTDSRDTTVLLASRAVPRLKLSAQLHARSRNYPQGADLLEAQWLAVDSLPSRSVALFNEQRSWARALTPVAASTPVSSTTTWGPTCFRPTMPSLRDFGVVSCVFV